MDSSNSNKDQPKQAGARAGLAAARAAGGGAADTPPSAPATTGSRGVTFGAPSQSPVAPAMSQTLRALAENPLPPQPVEPAAPTVAPDSPPAPQGASAGTEQPSATSSEAAPPTDLLQRLRKLRSSLPPLNIAQYIMGDGEVTQVVEPIPGVQVTLRRYREAEVIGAQLLAKELMASTDIGDQIVGTILQSRSWLALSIHSVGRRLTAPQATVHGATQMAQQGATREALRARAEVVAGWPSLTTRLMEIEVELFAERCAAQLTEAAIKNG